MRVICIAMVWMQASGIGSRTPIDDHGFTSFYCHSAHSWFRGNMRAWNRKWVTVSPPCNIHQCSMESVYLKCQCFNKARHLVHVFSMMWPNSKCHLNWFCQWGGPKDVVVDKNGGCTAVSCPLVFVWRHSATTSVSIFTVKQLMHVLLVVFTWKHILC